MERKLTLMTVPCDVQVRKGLRVQNSLRKSSVSLIRLINTVENIGTVRPEMFHRNVKQSQCLELPCTTLMIIVVMLKTLPRNLFFNNLKQKLQFHCLLMREKPFPVGDGQAGDGQRET